MTGILDPVNASLYALSATVGLAIAALLLRGTPSRVLWWEWPALVVPLAVWWLVWSIPTFTDGRKSLANLAEPVILGLVVGCLGLALRWLGTRWVSPNVVRPAFVGACCVAAVLVALYTPMLPE